MQGPFRAAKRPLTVCKLVQRHVFKHLYAQTCMQNVCAGMHAETGTDVYVHYATTCRDMRTTMYTSMCVHMCVQAYVHRQVLERVCIGICIEMCTGS